MIIINKIKKLLLFILCFICLVVPLGIKNGNTLDTLKTNSTTDYVVLGGESIGLNISTSVKVTGMFDVKTDDGKVKPWLNSDISIDDEIVSLNNCVVKDIESFKSLIQELKDTNNPVKIVVKRKNGSSSEQIETNINIIKNRNNEYSIGLYVKDNVLGVGTLTYYDVKDSSFGALGHSAITQTFVKGTIYNSRVTGVTKGVRGIPGEKKAVLNAIAIGEIVSNNEFGIFGKLTKTDTSYELTPVAKSSEVKEGHAQIITVISGDKKEYFDIEIIDVKRQLTEGIKGIKFIVTDQELLEKTGGIIQGMSGSPIIQNGKLIGAVSHVLVDDSSIGYGVFAEWMIQYS